MNEKCSINLFMGSILISTRKYNYDEFKPFFHGPVKVTLTKDSERNINRSHKHLVSNLKSGRAIYGVNTGFGNLSNISICERDLEKLQLNLVRSHASGIGAPLSLGIVRVIMFLKLLTFSKGYSGVSINLVKTMVRLLNLDIIPIIPKKGSVGASGDLAPLGHMALVLIGEGEVFFKGKKIKTKTAFKKTRIAPLSLKAKEGLSLINGTQVSTAIAIKTLIDGKNLLLAADIAGALSVENSFSSKKVFSKKIHDLKQHPGQKASARNILKLLNDSDIVSSHNHCGKIQDPYSFRCIPHVHGASRDMFNNAVDIINNEINSVSDNPLVFDKNSIETSGHFHAEHVAMALDSLAISFSELGSISERRIHYFMKGVEQKIPQFVAINPGLESGYMIAHVTSSSLVSENKTLSHPASIDSLPTSGGQEDLVSMAPWAGYKLIQIQRNVNHIFAIELIVAGAANYVASKGMKSGKGTSKVLKLLNEVCSFSNGDRSLQIEITNIYKILKLGRLQERISKYLILE